MPCSKTDRRLVQRVSLVVAQMLVAALGGVVLAPRLLAGLDAVLPGATPAWIWLPLRYVAYELGLFGMAFGVWATALRVGWSAGPWSAGAVLLSPALAEASVSLLTGRLPPGLGSGIGMGARAIVLLGALGGVVVLLQRRARAHHDPRSP